MRCVLVLVLLALPSMACGGARDLVQTATFTGADMPSVVINGRRDTGCATYQLFRSLAPVGVGDYVASAGCPSEAAVFAGSNAMGLKDTSGTWTIGSDIATIPMRAPYAVPINVFIMSGDYVQHRIDLRQAEAANDISTAVQLFDANQCGITVQVNLIKDVSKTGNFQPNLLTADCVGNVPLFKAVDTQTAQTGLNVFYYDGDGDQGNWCQDGPSAVIVLGQWKGPEALAHEIGHALSLQHTNDIPGMPLDDLMMSPSSYPASLTLGQCFRTNVNTPSVLHSLGIRTDPSRTCSDVGLECPPLTIHR